MSEVDFAEPEMLSEHPGGDSSGMLDATAYLAVAAGFLFSVLTASHLNLVGLVLLTVLNALFLGIFRRLSSEEVCTEHETLLLSVTAIGITVAVESLAFLGMGFDWLLPVVTATLMGIFYPWRRGIVFASAILLITLALLFFLDGRRILPGDFITMPPAFAFAFAFAVVIRSQFQQRARAEQLVAQLETAQAELRARASEAEELAVTRERNRMAREIHDTLGHYLTLLAVQLETATKLEERGDPRLRAELAEARRVASECLTEVRRSVAALRPADPMASSFSVALRRLVTEFEASLPETEIVVDVETAGRQLPADLRVAFFRAVQESLTNIRKHAQATKVLVRLRVEGEQVDLTVLDNGVGAASTADGHEAGYGLIGMRERIELIGGTARSGPEPEHGWRVSVQAPLPSAQGESVAVLAAS